MNRRDWLKQAAAVVTAPAVLAQVAEYRSASRGATPEEATRPYTEIAGSDGHAVDDGGWEVIIGTPAAKSITLAELKAYMRS